MHRNPLCWFLIKKCRTYLVYYSSKKLLQLSLPSMENSIGEVKNFVRVLYIIQSKYSFILAVTQLLIQILLFPSKFRIFSSLIP